MSYTYADKADILRYHDKRVVTQLTIDDDTIDYEDESNIDEGVLQDMENAAARTVDNHLRNVYPSVPLTGSDVTEEIVQITAALTWSNLWRRRGEEPQQVTELRNEVMDRLRDMTEIGAKEVRGDRKSSMRGVRSKTGKARTMFDDAGYFDGLPSRGSRRLSGDREN